jgi:two-component system, cell cycle sensor histidine kinase and response regulator CckA
VTSSPRLSGPCTRPNQRTVLIVDDQEILRRVIGQELEGVGFRVLQADDGRTAWGILERGTEPVDLIITDIVMPVMGGVELAARIATLPSPPPVIFISAYGRGVITMDRPFLIKPFDPEQLTALVYEILAPPAA